MDQLDIAIHQTGLEAHGGIEALARRLGIGAQVLRNKLCPTTDTHKLTLRESMSMMDATGDCRILVVMNEMLGYEAPVRKKLPDAQSIVQAVLGSDVEHGDTMRTIQHAISDGKITEKEKADIIHHIERERERLEVLQSTMTHAPTFLKVVE
jgi:hypothetical protein